MNILEGVEILKALDGIIELPENIRFLELKIEMNETPVVTVEYYPNAKNKEK